MSWTSFVRVDLIITAVLLYTWSSLCVCMCTVYILYTCNVTSIMICIHTDCIHLHESLMANNQGNQLINYLGLTTIIQFQCRTVRTSIQDNYIYCYRLILNCKRRCCSGYQLSGGNCERKSLNWSKYALHFNLNNVYIYSRSTVLLSDNRRRGCVAFQTGIFYTSLAHTHTHTPFIYPSSHSLLSFVRPEWSGHLCLSLHALWTTGCLYVHACHMMQITCNAIHYSTIALHCIQYIRIYILYYTALYIYTLVMYNLYRCNSTWLVREHVCVLYTYCICYILRIHPLYTNGFLLHYYITLLPSCMYWWLSQWWDVRWPRNVWVPEQLARAEMWWWWDFICTNEH